MKRYIYKCRKIEKAPIRSEYQQTYLALLPTFDLWFDGTKYKQCGVHFRWWKWSIMFMFDEVQKESIWTRFKSIVPQQHQGKYSDEQD